ncbi:MAG: hypothetical protein JSW71_03640, partial [Gemmatimonadota bacterium]
MERRITAVAFCLFVMTACGGTRSATEEPEPSQAVPLPTGGIAGEPVSVYPLTMLVTQESLGWEGYVQPRREALDRADSLIAAFLTERAPEAIWVLPDELRTAASRAPGMLAQPDQMATSLLRTPFERVPDPLRIQLRSLTGVAGGKYAFIPASLVFYAEAEGQGRAELTMVLVDVRLGRPVWRSVAEGTGSDP